MLNIPRRFIYKDRYSLDDFHIYKRGHIDCVFYTVIQGYNVLSSPWEELEDTYINMLNDLHYILTLVAKDKRPELEMDKYRSIAAGDDDFPPNNAYQDPDDNIRIPLTMCMVYCILNRYPGHTGPETFFLENLKYWIKGDTIFKCIFSGGNNSVNCFTIISGKSMIS